MSQQPPMVTGTVDHVPCPACGKPNDFRGHEEVLEVGNTFACDHCKHPMQVGRVRKNVTIVSVHRQTRGNTPVKQGR